MQTSLIGRPAPPFELHAVSFSDREERPVTLSGFAGRWLILLFYPRDFSFVCPTELTAFSATLEEFRSRGCDILALSVDSLQDHRRWFETPVSEGGIGPLQFPLASDPDGQVSREYGVWLENGNCSARGLFIIDPAGVLQYAVTHNTSVGRSTEETLRVLEALQSGGLCPSSWTAADGTIDVESQLQPGRILGSYRIVVKLGAGAFGNVFAADDLALERRVAIKIIGRKASGARDKVLAEARAAARLHHRNICTVFSVDTVETVPVIVMEFIDGQVLSGCDLKALAPEARRQIALGAAEGLAVAHSFGVVHGDLKPANIMVTREGDAKLLDFGFSRRLGGSSVADLHDQPSDPDKVGLEETIVAEIPREEDHRRPGRLTGTLAYMSPELTQGYPATLPSDVYAFGLVLTQLITGQLPLRLVGLPQVLKQIRSGEVCRAAGEMVPADFREIIQSALADRPESRPRMPELIQAIRHREFPAIA